ncbi:MAG: flippase [Bifidobacterium breve]|nr:flippase [Bifidobacterium breve]
MKIHSVKFNVLMNMIVTTSSLIFPLITVPYVSRVLSTGGTGHVAFAQSVSSYFSLVALLGVTYYGVRACASVRDDGTELSRTVKELLVILGCSTTVVSIVYVACLFTVPKMNAQFELFLLFGLSIWLASFGVEWFYQALEQYEYITVRSVCFKILALVLMFAFVRERGDYVTYGLIVVVAGYGSNVLNLLRLRKFIDLHDGAKLDVKRHFKPMLWFVIASISSGMYIQVDIVMLGFLGTTNMVGLYQLVSKIKSVLVTAVNSVGNVMLPRLSYYQAQNKERRAGELIAKNMNFVMVFGSAIIVLLILLADPIVALLGGSDFADSEVPLRCVGVAVMFSAMNIVLANHMISKGKERSWATVNAIGLVLAVVANCVLIPRFGVVGSAISISLCEALMFAMRSYVCREFLSGIRGLIDPIRIFCSAGFSGIATYIVLALCGCSAWNAFLWLVCGGILFSIIYGTSLLVCREQFVTGVIRPILNKIQDTKEQA